MIMSTRIPNIYGGGANTNVNGLRFEQTTSLDTTLKRKGFEIIDDKVYYKERTIGWSVGKNKLYKKFLTPLGIDYSDYNSKKWQPDECFINELNNTAYIIEKKFQSSRGSVDEKLPGCHFKKMEYEKLFHPLGYDVEFIYVFNNWFEQDEYKDTKEYISLMGCYYFFNEIPLKALGIDFCEN